MKLFKQLFIGSLAILFAINSQAQLKTPPASSFQSVKQSFALSEINLEYSRPNAKGRKVFGGLVPYGKIWRTGANNSTVITLGEDVKINGQDIKAGTYSILSIPDKDSWTVLFNTDTKLGSNVAAYDNAKEVLRLKVKPAKTTYTETFTINFSNVKPASADMDILWENTLIKLNIVADIDGKIMAKIDEEMKGAKPPYYQAASYYYDNNKDMKKALEWVSKAEEQMPNAFWVAAQKARIQLKLNDKKGAAVSAQKVIDMAKKANNNDYVVIGTDLLNQARK